MGSKCCQQETFIETEHQFQTQELKKKYSTHKNQEENEKFDFNTNILYLLEPEEKQQSLKIKLIKDISSDIFQHQLKKDENLFQNDHFWIIDETGLAGSLRLKLDETWDGYTYFGQYDEELDQKITLDVNLWNFKNEESHFGRHFCIRLNEDRRLFTIQDLGIGFGTFYKIQKDPIILKNQMLINFGMQFFQAIIQKQNQGIVTGIDSLDKTLKSSKLLLKGYYNEQKDQLYEILPAQKQATIGRYHKNTIQIDGDQRLSKTHCLISYNEEDDQWLITDGNGKQPSSNGTWIYLNEETDIYNGMIFKANKLLFEAEIGE